MHAGRGRGRKKAAENSWRHVHQTYHTTMSPTPALPLVVDAPKASPTANFRSSLSNYRPIRSLRTTMTSDLLLFSAVSRTALMYLYQSNVQAVHPSDACLNFNPHRPLPSPYKPSLLRGFFNLGSIIPTSLYALPQDTALSGNLLPLSP